MLQAKLSRYNQPIQTPWVDFSWAYNRGGSGSYPNYPKQYGWIRMSQTRCTGFSTSSNIGYGSCTSLSYEPFISSTLCICSTNLCNVNMATCQASVQSSTPPPSLMPPLISSFSLPISCVDDYSFVGYGFYYFSFYNSFLYNSNFSLFSSYFSSNTVMCMISYNTQTNYTFRTPLGMEEYDAAVNMYWDMYAVDHVYGYSNYQITSGTGNLLVSYVGNGGHSGVCYCTSSNCNVDLATCTSGLSQSSNVSTSISSTTTIATGMQTSNGTTSIVTTTRSISITSTTTIVTGMQSSNGTTNSISTPPPSTLVSGPNTTGATSTVVSSSTNVSTNPTTRATTVAQTPSSTAAPGQLSYDLTNINFLFLFLF